jgi:hypothetical protein
MQVAPQAYSLRGLPDVRLGGSAGEGSEAAAGEGVVVAAGVLEGGSGPGAVRVALVVE